MEKEYEVKCRDCGSADTIGVTRVVGYFSKVAELKDRQKGDYSVARDRAMPCTLDYGKDGVYLVAKSGCPMCDGQDRALKVALKRTGLEEKVPVHITKTTDDNEDIIPKNLAFAVKTHIPLTSLPAIVMIKDGRIGHKSSTIYEEGKPATISTPQILVEQLIKLYPNENNPTA